MEMLSRLRYAVVATRHGGGAATVAANVRRAGLETLDATLRSLADDQRAAVEETVNRLATGGVDAVLLGDDMYPPALSGAPKAPAALFTYGPRELLSRPGLGMCGSRHATPEGLRAARACGEVVASHGFNVVSGYAKGVDMAAHSGALASGGTTVIVLAEGIEHFNVRQGDFADLWDSSRAAVVSQFSPTQPWSAGAAMTRNAVISGLSKALVVVEAGDRGGTLAAGLHAIDRGQPVMVLQLFGARSGNQLLQDRGATPIRSRHELEQSLDDLPTNGSLQLTLM